MKRYQMAEEGLNTNIVRDVEVAYKVSKRQMAGFLGVSEKTYYTLMSQVRLDTDRSDRFLFIEKIFDEGEDTFGFQENFRGWLNTAHPNLGNQKPIALMESLTGAEAVYAEILRTRHSVVS